MVPISGVIGGQAAGEESQTLATIGGAFEKLREVLHPTDIRLFRSTTLEDVRSAAKIIERDQEQRRCLRNLRRIEPLLQALRKFGTALDVLCQGTPYLCFVWAPIKLLLQIADEYTGGFNKLIDAYHQIANYLPRFDRLASVFSHQIDFHSVLADVYEDILEFHRHAYKFLRRSGWKHLFDASWRSFGGRFNAILQNLARNQDLVDKEAASFDMLESKACRQRLLEDVEKREVERQEWQLRDTLAWLDLKGQDLEQQELFERRSNARETGTCQWILENPTIGLWLNPDDHRLFFWLRGKPGSGKTTIATYLVEEAPLPPTAHILYCLCSYGFGRSERNACSLIFRSLIAQVLRKQLDLLPYIYDNYVKIGAVPSLAKVRELLKNLLECSERVFLVLDGLDEFEGPDQKQVIDEIGSLMPRRPDPYKPNLKVLVCSRETRELIHKIGQNAQISLSEHDRFVSRDIATFTRKSLSELRDRFEDDLVAKTGNDVVQKANGMFLWVQLVLSTILEQESVQDLRSVVEHLPPGLQGVYKFILNRIQNQMDERQQIRARRILSWLSFACRPLKVWEVCSGIVFHDENGNLNDESKLGKGILDICKPLIEERDQETVALVHFSAREFLLHQTSGPYLSSFVAQAEIATSCARYLLTCTEFATGAPSPSAFGHIVKGFHDIFPYVHEFWPEHLAKCVDPKDGRDDRIWKTLVDQLCHLVATFSRPGASMDPEPGHQLVSTNATAASGREFPALPQPVQKYLDFRQSTSTTTTLSRVESRSLNVKSDLTLLTNTYSCFRLAFESLMNEETPFSHVEMKINTIDIERFIHRHRSAAYCCTWSGCMWASTGFRTPTERADHENSHKKQFRCSDPTCDFADNGFASRSALRTHVLKYHTKEENLVLPQFPLSSYTGSTPIHQDAAPDSSSRLILWRKDIQYDFLQSVFRDKTAVFRGKAAAFRDQKAVFNRRGRGRRRGTFAQIYIYDLTQTIYLLETATNYWARSMYYMLATRGASRGLAMNSFLVNVGLRDHHSTKAAIPALEQRATCPPMPDFQAIDGLVKGALEDTTNKTGFLAVIKRRDAPRTNAINLISVLSFNAPEISGLHFSSSVDFLGLVNLHHISSKSRARAFLWLMWWYLESDFTKEDALNNPFGPGTYEEGVTEGLPQHVPQLEYLTKDQMDAENVDSKEEIRWNRRMERR